MGKLLQSPKRFALAFLPIGTLSFGSASILTRLCAFPATIIASGRILIAGLIIAPFCISQIKELFQKNGFKGFLLLVIPGFILGLHFQFWVIGIKQTSIASGTFILSISPIFFALFERIISRKRLTIGTLIALGLVLTGAFWLFRVGHGQLGRIGDAFCFISMLLYVAYLLVTRQVSRDVPHLAYIHIIYLWGGLLTLPFALLSGDTARVNLADTGSFLALIALVVFPTLIGHTSYNYAVRTISPLTVSFFIPLEPILATIAAVPILSEAPDPAKLPAYLLFLSATVFYILTQRQRQGRQPQ